MPFLGKFGWKSQDCQFEVKYGIRINSNMQNSMILLTVSILDQTHLFWANLVQTIKIVKFGT